MVLVVAIVLAWHASYFLVNKQASSVFLFQEGMWKYDVLDIPLLLPVCWWIGRKYDEARFFSERDPLTSVYNRRFIFDVFPSVLEAANARNEEVRVFLLDVDDFKEINDHHGHEVGDAVIREVAFALVRHTRKTDLVSRWGGDEFLVIASRNRREVRQTGWLDVDLVLAEATREVGLSLSISVGVATYPMNGVFPDALIKAADVNMYERKAIKKALSK